MVSAAPGSAQEKLLQKHPGYLKKEFNSQKNTTQILISIKNQNELIEIAQRIHSDQNGFPCGQLEFTDSYDLLQETPLLDAFLGPIYPDAYVSNDLKNDLSQLKSENILKNIESLSSLKTRQVGTETGNRTGEFVKQLVTTALNNDTSRWQLELIDHDDYSQQSLVVKLNSNSTSDETIILGSHLDSIHPTDKTVAPGADDNASGVSTLIEIIRVIHENNFIFARNLEFHFYALEEIGLIGSRDLAKQYRKQNKKIAAMLQMDMNSYSQDPNNFKIFLVTNDTSPNLRHSLKNYIVNYDIGSVEEKNLPKGSSDHKSWTLQSYHAVFPFEDPTAYNSNLHTENDDVAHLNNTELSEQFAKLGLTFLAHYAGLEEIKSNYDEKDFPIATNIDDDFKIALVKSTFNSAKYDFIVANKNNAVAQINICEVASPAANFCHGTLINLTKQVKESSLSFFLNESDSPSTILNSSPYFRLFGYDSTGKEIALRNIQTLKK